MSKRRFMIWTSAAFVCGFGVSQLLEESATAEAQGRKVYELRTYTAPDGKLPQLLARFRDHTVRFFDKHGMQNVGYWVPQEAPASGNTLMYILAHDSREAASKSWESFRKDPDWQRVREQSQVEGPIVTRVESVFLEATDFSPLQ